MATHSGQPGGTNYRVTRCYPPDPDFPEDRRAERAVWEALRDQLPDNAALFHSVQLKERGNDYEADLVVAWPGVGIGVIEVKGGVISYASATWKQSGRAGDHTIGDPIVQAQDAKHVLERFLKPRATLVAQARFAHLVAFPYTGVPADWETPGCSREMVIGKADLGNAAAVTKRAIDETGGGHQPLTDAGCEQLVDFLTMQLGGQTSLLSDAEEHEQRVAQMTRDQSKYLGMLRYQRRAKIMGGAGTGKTWLALEHTRRLVKSGERVALVCYSRGLARFFERVTGTWPASDRPAYAGLFHSLPLQWGAKPPPADTSDLDAQSEYYETLLPAQMGQLAATLPIHQRFDSIVIDEAQDFGDAWWPPVLACLKDGDDGGLFAYLDNAQRIFNRYGEVPISLPPFPLDDNIRNTKRIAQTFGSLAEEQSRYLGLEGPPVRFIQCETADALDAADGAVEDLVDAGWDLGQIALLTTGRRHLEQIEVVDYGGWAAYWDEFFAETSVFYGHVLGFKGLERSAVVLAVNGIRDAERAREMLYVGLSRARTQLVVCGDLDTIGQYGGRALRKRLDKAVNSIP
jgi:Nuclease-related domain/UvrD-like helicase C-terminal domain/PhoH-like protein